MRILENERRPVSSEINVSASGLALSVLLSGAIAVFAGAAVRHLFARRRLAPLLEMAESASKISQATLGERVDYEGPAEELRTLAESLNAMLARLETAFGAQQRFLSDASHELRTPLSVIRGNVDLLKHPKTTSEEKSEALRVVDEETRRMARMLEDLLALARMEAGSTIDFQPLEVSTLLSEASARAAALGAKQMTLECSPDLWIFGDQDLLEQSLLNILLNAIQHGQAKPVELGCEVKGRSIFITIRDHGPGIAEEVLPRIFERFYRAPQPGVDGHRGSGLGLAITKALIEQHGGTISAENAEGGGARFTISLPTAPEP